MGCDELVSCDELMVQAAPACGDGCVILQSCAHQPSAFLLGDLVYVGLWRYMCVCHSVCVRVWLAVRAHVSRGIPPMLKTHPMKSSYAYSASKRANACDAVGRAAGSCSVRATIKSAASLHGPRRRLTACANRSSRGKGQVGTGGGSVAPVRAAWYKHTSASITPQLNTSTGGP